MVDFRPFRGIRYRPGVAGPLDRLVCPPYDVISLAQERVLLEGSDFNMVRLELTEAPVEPDGGRYPAAARTYHQWLHDGVLGYEDGPTYYLLRQRFAFEGVARERYSLTGALRLEELGTGVLPHEDTAAGPKADRLALMEACHANFSPLMALFEDTDKVVERARHAAIAHPPTAEFSGDDGQDYALWRIADGESVAAIAATLAPRRLYITDGHHRYETALNYAKARAENGGGEPAADFVMMSIIDFDDPGLLILPYYRVVHGLSAQLLTQLRERIVQVFLNQPVAIDTTSPGPLEALVAQEGVARAVLSLVGSGTEGTSLLTVRDAGLVERYSAEASSPAMGELEAWLLQEVVLRPVLGDDFARHVTYTHDGQAALDQVREGGGQLAFFLKGVPRDLFVRLVGAGIRMPRKSTYFHPKLPSGVVMYSLEGAAPGG